MTTLTESLTAYSRGIDIVKKTYIVVEAAECISVELIVSPRIYVKYEH